MIAQRARTYVGILGAFGAGVLVTTLLLAPEHLCIESYAHLSDSVHCQLRYVIDKKSYASLEAKLKEEIQGEIASGRISSASLYFRDLERGPVFGIDEDQSLYPASLLGITLILAYYDIAQSYPEVMQELVPSPDEKQATVRDELLKLAKENDREAYMRLREHLSTLQGGDEYLLQQASELGLRSDTAGSIEPAISTKSYSSILHSLFFARLFPASVSDEILELLNDELPKKGIAAALPDSVRVVHRIGIPERMFDGILRIHDCGIVYYPGNPYSLCIVVAGKSEEDMLRSARGLARLIFDEVDSRELR